MKDRLSSFGFRRMSVKPAAARSLVRESGCTGDDTGATLRPRLHEKQSRQCPVRERHRSRGREGRGTVNGIQQQVFRSRPAAPCDATHRHARRVVFRPAGPRHDAGQIGLVGTRTDRRCRTGRWAQGGRVAKVSGIVVSGMPVAPRAVCRHGVFSRSPVRKVVYTAEGLPFRRVRRGRWDWRAVSPAGYRGTVALSGRTQLNMVFRAFRGKRLRYKARCIRIYCVARQTVLD